MSIDMGIRARSADNTVSVVQRMGLPLPVLVRIPEGHGAEPVTKLNQGSWILGAGPDADVVVNEATVSQRHLELQVIPEGILVRDLDSRNGTFYLGQRIRELVVGPGARIRAGNVEIAFELDPSALAPSDGGPARYGDLVAASPAMRKLFAMLERLEGSLVGALIEGEAGTGKERIARAIHERSAVAQGPFLAVNCGAVRRALVQSELFGHRKSASESRIGAFEAAHGGTLFLDEIGELPLDVQPILLRAIEERKITRGGEHQSRAVSVRLLAATNRGLAERVAAGEFREDLHDRLKVVNIKVPPLRERAEDVRLLATVFARNAGAEELPQSILKQISMHSWPGNVRELRHAIESYLAIGHLPSGDPTPQHKLEHALSQFIDPALPYQQLKEAFLEAFARSYVSRLLVRTGGNVSEAARISGLERSYLNKLAHRFGVRG
jgi:DNA-binding NtrC family response regulator